MKICDRCGKPINAHAETILRMDGDCWAQVHLGVNDQDLHFKCGLKALIRYSYDAKAITKKEIEDCLK